MGAEFHGLHRARGKHVEALPVDSPGHHSHREVERLGSFDVDRQARINLGKGRKMLDVIR